MNRGEDIFLEAVRAKLDAMPDATWRSVQPLREAWQEWLQTQPWAPRVRGRVPRKLKKRLARPGVRLVPPFVYAGNVTCSAPGAERPLC